jgi:hypothetical protein
MHGIAGEKFGPPTRAHCEEDNRRLAPEDVDTLRWMRTRNVPIHTISPARQSLALPVGWSHAFGRATLRGAEGERVNCNHGMETVLLVHGSPRECFL